MARRNYRVPCVLLGYAYAAELFSSKKNGPSFDRGCLEDERGEMQRYVWSWGISRHYPSACQLTARALRAGLYSRRSPSPHSGLGPPVTIPSRFPSGDNRRDVERAELSLHL